VGSSSPDQAPLLSNKVLLTRSVF